MAVVRVVRLVCDLCRRLSPRYGDETEAVRASKGRGWRVVAFDGYGNQGHVCPDCAGGPARGMSDEELAGLVIDSQRPEVKP
jgi:hypothetical protein